MNLLAGLNHLLNFVAPALVMAVLVAGGGRFFIKKAGKTSNWRSRVAINFVVNCLVLVAGLMLLGRDGKMLTYAALVVACATSEWVQLRGWRG